MTQQQKTKCSHGSAATTTLPNNNQPSLDGFKYDENNHTKKLKYLGEKRKQGEMMYFESNDDDDDNSLVCPSAVPTIVTDSSDSFDLAEKLGNSGNEGMGAMDEEEDDEDAVVVFDSGDVFEPTVTMEYAEEEEFDPTYFLSLEQLQGLEIQGNNLFKVPRPADWKEGESKVEISIDRARRELWKQCCREIELAKTNLSKEFPNSTTNFQKEQAVFVHLLGPKSDIAKILMTAAGIDPVEYCDFLYSVFTSAQLSQHMKSIEKNTSIRDTMLLSNNQYNKIWNKIDKAGKVTLGQVRSPPVWMDIEGALNKFFKKMFMSDDVEFRYVVGLDDDKVHFEWKRCSDTKGLKRMQHVKANARGHVLHTACHSASGAPIHVTWMQEKDTEETCYRRCVGKTFGTATGENSIPKIPNVVFCSDRGYWSIPLLFSFILASGAGVGGTLKRSDWIPYTFERKGSCLPTKPENLEINAYKCAFFKEVEFLAGVGKGVKRRMQVCAYRSGTGTSMSLVMSTQSRGRHWDFQTLHAKDAAWSRPNSGLSQSERNAKAFHLAAPEASLMTQDEIERAVKLFTANVQPRTCEQNHADWFMDRMFSVTSSIASFVVRKAAVKIFPSHPMREAFEKVLIYARMKDLLPKEDPVSEDGVTTATTPVVPGESETEATAATATPGSSSDETTINENPLTIPPEGNLDDVVDVWFNFLRNLVNLNDIERAVKFITLASATDIEIMRSDVVNGILKKIGASPVKDDNKNRKKLIEWIEADIHHREFIFMKKTDLVLHPLARLVSKINSRKVGEIRELLADLHKRQSNSDPELEEQLERQTERDVSEEDLLSTILARSFLAKQSQQQSETDARLIGHSNEAWLIKKCFEEIGGIGNEISSIFRVGLVANVSRKYMKASADALAVLEGQKEKFCPVELKTVVSTERIEEMEERVMRNVGANSYEQGRAYFPVVVDEDLHTWVHESSWLMQTLHQAATFECKESRLAVGTERSLLFVATTVFSSDLIDSYLKIVDWVFEKYLKPLYGKEGLDEDFRKRVERCLETNALKKAKVDLQSFDSLYGIWHRLNVDCPNDIFFPLPSCSRIIPYVNSYWNGTKHPSDTITKMMDSCEAKLGVLSSSTKATLRLLELSVIGFQRLDQFITAKENPAAHYSSLSHWHNAASHRVSFVSAFEKIKRMLRLTKAFYQPVIQRAPNPIEEENRVRCSERNKHFVCQQIAPDRKYGATPGKKKRSVEQQALAQVRNEKCLGLSFIVKEGFCSKTRKVVDQRHECALCGVSKTPWYCTGCSRYLCGSSIQVNRMIDKKKNLGEEERGKEYIKFKVYNEATKKIEEVECRRTCYVMAHIDAWKEHWARRNDLVSNNKGELKELLNRLDFGKKK